MRWGFGRAKAILLLPHRTSFFFDGERLDGSRGACLRTQHRICVFAFGFLLAATSGFRDVEAAADDELPQIPAAPRLEVPRPDPKSLTELDARLAALSSDEAGTRDAAARELLEVDPRLVAAVSFRLDTIADRADKEALKRLFLDIRRESRDVEKAETDADEDDKRGKPASDYLAMLVNQARPKSKAYPDLVAIVGMSRMLSEIGSVEAARALIGVYVRFGEFLRVHVQREIARLGDKAVPALIEARRHPAEKIARWSARQLDALGRAAPSLAVQIQDHQVLADVLTAYGRVRDLDATRIVVSFANSERAVVRVAARQAIGLFGEVGMWQLRDAYEALVGKKPARDWSWERTARELFAEFDRARSAVVAKAFETGRNAREKGDLVAMRKAFDEVVVHDPRFERRSELAAGYFAYAERYFEEQPAEAEVALIRAERYSDDTREKDRARSRVLTLRAAQAVKRGVADLSPLTRAIELDATNQRAAALLAELRRGKADRQSERARTLAAGSVLLGALAAILVLLRRRSSPATPAPSRAPESTGPASAAPESPAVASSVGLEVPDSSASAGVPESSPSLTPEPTLTVSTSPSAPPASPLTREKPEKPPG